MIGRLLALAVASTVLGCSEAPSTSVPTVVETQEGIVQGAIEDGLVVFRGIPYAAPPVGPLRWRPPMPPASWQGVRNATEFGPSCPSVDGSRISEGRRVVGGGADVFINVPLAPGSSEDCLHLNLWAPLDAERAAVMVWLQPLGASSLSVFDGAAFARDGVVFVSLDYRQLTLGNFAHPALTNEAQPEEPLVRFQTMDQLAALTWIKRNIAEFGGDAENVVVFGQSASAASTLQLLTLPDAKGLIDKAIVQSGVGWWTPWNLSQMERMGVLLARQAGLPLDASSDQLRALTPDALPQLGVYSIDGRLQPENATTAIDEGRMADVPLLIGWTDFDGSSLRGRGAEDVVAAASDELLAVYASDGLSGADLGYQIYTDSHVGAPARWIASRASPGAPSYLYLFSYVRAENRGKVRGAAHGDDMFFLFDAWEKLNPQISLNEEDRSVSRRLRSCWVSFAKTGTPRCEGGPDWPRYTPGDDQLMEIGLSSNVKRNFREQQFDAQEAVWRAGADEAARSVEDALRRMEGELQPTN
jgi:para-nitrobenzyl esterase